MERTMRMTKGWTLVGTNATDFGKIPARAEVLARNRKADNFIKHAVSLPIDDLIKEAEETYAQQRKEQAGLIQAFENKKLKSKTLIKKAKSLRKRNILPDAVEPALWV